MFLTLCVFSLEAQIGSQVQSGLFRAMRLKHVTIRATEKRLMEDDENYLASGFQNDGDDPLVAIKAQQGHHLNREKFKNDWKSFRFPKYR